MHFCDTIEPYMKQDERGRDPFIQTQISSLHVSLYLLCNKMSIKSKINL